MKGLVVVPFYNEGEIAKLYSEELILAFQSSDDINVDFYLVNDFSSDDTKNYLDSIKIKYNNVVLQNNKENLGHGKTVVSFQQCCFAKQQRKLRTWENCRKFSTMLFCKTTKKT